MKASSLLMIGMLLLSCFGRAEELKVNDPAPLFVAKKHDGKTFDLGTRKGLWTVLYFYPKSGTSGCTKEARAFQEQLIRIRVQGADVFGVSMNTVSEQAAFRKEQNLRFTLLADPEANVVDLYGARVIPARQSKRWTLIIDPDLIIREIQKEVDPVRSPESITKRIIELKAERSERLLKGEKPVVSPEPPPAETQPAKSVEPKPQQDPAPEETANPAPDNGKSDSAEGVTPVNSSPMRKSVPPEANPTSP